MAAKKVLRRTQRLGVDHDEAEDADEVPGKWIDIKFHQLRKGHIFRLFDTDKDGTEKPDRLTDEGNHEVCVALSDAQPTGGGAGLQNYSVQSQALLGF